VTCSKCSKIATTNPRPRSPHSSRRRIRIRRSEKPQSRTRSATAWSTTLTSSRFAAAPCGKEGDRRRGSNRDQKLITRRRYAPSTSCRTEPPRPLRIAGRVRRNSHRAHRLRGKLHARLQARWPSPGRHLVESKDAGRDSLIHTAAGSTSAKTNPSRSTTSPTMVSIVRVNMGPPDANV
jgi:hypothetical protein